MFEITLIAWKFDDPAVQAAIIQSAGAVIAAIIAAVCAAIVGRYFANRKRLMRLLELAQGDVAFLLAVEAEHGKLHLQQGYTSTMKATVRRTVREEQGLAWSARFTPARVARSRPVIGESN
jgi:hypothetical protein